MPARHLPLAADGTLPPLALLARWLAAGDGAPVLLDAVPPLSGCLPGLLRLAGVGSLGIAQHEGGAFRWEGLGGGRVVVDAPADAETDALPLHHGPLPPHAWPGDDDDGRLLPALELSRLADAHAVLGAAEGAAWDALVAALEAGQPPRLPPLAGRGRGRGEGALGAWNPLPFARRAVAVLPAPGGSAPWALREPRTGALHPLQVIEGPLGRELLVELPLGALACVHLEAHDEPAAGAAWEVGDDVLDNGVVRAEFDVHGQVERLCIGGAFVDAAAPLVRPLLDGLAVAGPPAAMRVLEDGPVRARVVATRELPTGTLHTTYTLIAHEPLLRVDLAWDGGADLVIEHPTTLRHHDALIAGETAAESRPQRPDVARAPLPPVAGARWAQLSDGHGGGLLLLARRPLAIAAHGGALRLPCRGTLAYALGDAARSDPARAQIAVAVEARPYGGGVDVAPALRLAGGAGVAPLWIRRAEDGSCELMLAELRLRRARLWLQPTGSGAIEAWRSDLRGRRTATLPTTPEGDAVQIDLHPGEVALVRWRIAP